MVLNGMKFPVLLHTSYISTVYKKVGRNCSYQNYEPLKLSDRVFPSFSMREMSKHRSVRGISAVEENRVSIQELERR